MSGGTRRSAPDRPARRLRWGPCAPPRGQVLGPGRSLLIAGHEELSGRYTRFDEAEVHTTNVMIAAQSERFFMGGDEAQLMRVAEEAPPGDRKRVGAPGRGEPVATPRLSARRSLLTSPQLGGFFTGSVGVAGVEVRGEVCLRVPELERYGIL